MGVRWVANITTRNSPGPNAGAQRCHSTPIRRPRAVGGIQPTVISVCTGRASTSNGAAPMMTMRCCTMCPENDSWASDSMNGSDATTTNATPPIHAHSRAVDGWAKRNQAPP